MADKVANVKIKLNVEGLDELQAAIRDLKKLDAAEEKVGDTAKKAGSKGGAGFMAMAGPLAATLITMETVKKAFELFMKSLEGTKAGKAAIESIKKSFDIVMNAIVDGLMPIVLDLAKMFAWVAPYIGNIVQFLSQTISTVFFAIKGVIAGAITVILNYWEGLINAFGFVVGIIPGFSKAGDAIKGFADKVGKASESAADATVDSFQKMTVSATTWAKDSEKVQSDAERTRLANQKAAHQKEMEEARKAAKMMQDIKDQMYSDEISRMDESLEKTFRTLNLAYKKQVADFEKSEEYKSLTREQKGEAANTLYENLLANRAAAEKKFNEDRAKEAGDADMALYNEELAAQADFVKLSEEIDRAARDGAIGRMSEGYSKRKAELDAQYANEIAGAESREGFWIQSEEVRDATLEKLRAEHLERVAALQGEANAVNEQGWTESQAKALEATEQTLNTVGAFASQIQSLVSNVTAMEIKSIDEATKKQKDKAKATIKNEAQLAKELDKIDKEAEKKKKQAQEKEKATAIVMAIINGAVAITRGFADLGPIGGAIMAVLTAAVTATQIAMIASQSFAKGGIVQGESMSGDKTLVRANAGELILNRAQQGNVASQLQSAPTINMGGDNIVINGNVDQNALDAIAQTRQDQISNMREMLLEMQYQGQGVPV